MRRTLTVLAALLGLMGAACEPSLSNDPLSGSFYITSDPPAAPQALTIRIDNAGDPSGWGAEFAAGELVVVDQSTLADEYGLRVNDQVCDGEFTIQTRVETDLLLHLTAAGCRVETTGSHPEDAVQHSPQPE